MSHHSKNPSRVSRPPRPPRVKVTFVVEHQLVPHDTPEPTFHDGIIAHVANRRFNQPLTAFASTEDAGPAFEAMVSRLEIPFDLQESDESGELLWGYGYESINDDRVNDVAAELAEYCAAIVDEAAEEAADCGPVKEFRLSVYIMKRTIVDAELYRSLPEELGHDFEAAVELLKTAVYGGDESDNDSDCAICLNDYSIGTRVSRVPCSHCFHEDCIVTWLKKSQTCPLCRFDLINRE